MGGRAIPSVTSSANCTMFIGYDTHSAIISLLSCLLLSLYDVLYLFRTFLVPKIRCTGVVLGGGVIPVDHVTTAGRPSPARQDRAARSPHHRRWVLFFVQSNAFVFDEFCFVQPIYCSVMSLFVPPIKRVVCRLHVHYTVAALLH